MKDNIVFTINIRNRFINEWHKNAFDLALKSIEQYAERIGADYQCCTDLKYAKLMTDKIGKTPHFEKFRINDLLKEYKRVLYVDSDIIITPHARDIFKEYSDTSKTYAFDESIMGRQGEITWMYNKFGAGKWPKNKVNRYVYFNSGVMLVSRESNPFSDWKPEEVFRIGSFHDQTYINYLIHYRGKQYGTITDYFNCMDPSLTIKRVNHNERFNMGFIHYAGYGYERQIKKHKYNIMVDDYNHLFKGQEMNLEERKPIKYHNPYGLCEHMHGRCGCGGDHTNPEFHKAYAKVIKQFNVKRVYEWGPGTSTDIAFKNGVTEVKSVEHDTKWIPKKEFPGKFSCKNVEVTSPDYIDITKTNNYDLYFIDARRRQECLDSVFDNTKDETIVCIHDAQRPRYDYFIKRYPYVIYLFNGFCAMSKSKRLLELIK